MQLCVHLPPLSTYRWTLRPQPTVRASPSAGRAQSVHRGSATRARKILNIQNTIGWVRAHRRCHSCAHVIYGGKESIQQSYWVPNHRDAQAQISFLPT